MVLGITIGILVMLVVLAYLSRKEEGGLLDRMSFYLFKICCIRRLPIVEKGQVRADLERLYPSASKREMQMEYYVNKFRLFLTVLLAGCLLTLVLCIKTTMENGQGLASLDRGKVGEGEQEVLLSATVGEQTEELHVLVGERQLEEEEVKTLAEACGEELQHLILGQNMALDAIVTDLYLPDRVEGYPFEILWRSSDTTLISIGGSLENVQGREGERVCLTAIFYYGETRLEQSFWVEIGEVEKEATLDNQLREALRQQDEASKYEESMTLPKELEGKEVLWKRIQEENSSLFLLLTLLAAVGVYFLKDKDLHEQVLERKRSLKLEYPTILNKLVLYMGAGMTVRGSFFKIAVDGQKKSIGKEISPVYEEMVFSCNELNAGVSEGLVYERFGSRSGLQEYARLATMLGQNLKKGNSTLLQRLREEADKAMQEDLQFRKKIGEEAETKLLIPMVMMLGVVMIMVMLPAFSAFE